jgi:plastocyanin
MRKVLTVLSTLGLVIAGCSSNSSSTASSATTAGGGSGAPASFTVNLEGNTSAFNGELAQFFPAKLSAHPGDTVAFNLVHTSGVPHTVTFGTLVDAAAGKLTQLGPTASVAAQENSPEMLNLPDVFPHKNPKGGPPDANQSAGQPCFMATGVPPLSLTGSAPACPKTAQPDFDGTQSFYNSGLISQVGDKFSVKLAANIKPGTYNFMCMIHRGAMMGSVTVAASTATIPSPDDVTTAGKADFDKMVSTVTPAAQAAQKGTADNAAMGSGDPVHYPNIVVAEFGPKKLSIPVNGSVTWHEFAFHTLAIGASAADVGAVAKAPDGSVHLGAKAGAPVGFQTPPALFEFPPPDDGKPVTVDYTYSGSGFANSGLVGSLPPVLVSFKVTFQKAGTYEVRCLVHNDMTSTVTVG